MTLLEILTDESLIELIQDGFSIATERHDTLDISVHFERITVQLDDLDILTEPWWHTKVQYPIEARATKEDHICVLENEAARSCS